MSGWGGWGGWIKSTVNSVVQEFSEAIADQEEEETAEGTTSEKEQSEQGTTTTSSSSSSSTSATSATTTTNKRADGVEIVDEEEVKQKEKEEEEEEEKGKEKVEEKEKEPETEETSEELLDTIENAIDQGTAFLATTTSFFGGLLQQGFELVKNSEEVSFISNRAANMASNSKKLLSEVTASSLEENLEAGQKAGLNALEAVGKATLGLLTHQTGPPERPRLRPIYMSSSSPSPSPSASPSSSSTSLVRIREESVASYFDDALGSAHEKAIELLATNCMMMMQRKQRLLTPTELVSFNAALVRVQNAFESEDAGDEDIDELAERILKVQSNSKVESHKACLLEMEQRFLQIATEFPSRLSAESLKEKEKNQQAQTVEPKQSVEGEDEPKPETKDEVKLKKADGSITQQEALNLLTEMRKESMKMIGELSAALVEQMLRVAESCLVDEEQQLLQSIAQDLGIQKATFIHSLCLVLSNRVGKLAGVFVNGFQQISNVVSEVLEEVVVEGAAEAEEVKSKVNQLLEQEVSRLSNDVFLDSGEAISYLHDAEKQTVTICKWMLLRWKQEEPPAPVPVPSPDSSPSIPTLDTPYEGSSSSNVPPPSPSVSTTTFSESNQEEPESTTLAEEKEVKEEVEEATKQEELVSTQKKEVKKEGEVKEEEVKEGEVKEEEMKKEQEGKKGKRNRNRNGKK